MPQGSTLSDLKNSKEFQAMQNALAPIQESLGLFGYQERYNLISQFNSAANFSGDSPGLNQVAAKGLFDSIETMKIVYSNMDWITDAQKNQALNAVNAFAEKVGQVAGSGVKNQNDSNNNLQKPSRDATDKRLQKYAGDAVMQNFMAGFQKAQPPAKVDGWAKKGNRDGGEHGHSSRHGDDRSRSRHGDERSPSRHGDERSPSRHGDDRSPSRHGDDRHKDDGHSSRSRHKDDGHNSNHGHHRPRH